MFKFVVLHNQSFVFLLGVLNPSLCDCGGLVHSMNNDFFFALESWYPKTTKIGISLQSIYFFSENTSLRKCTKLPIKKILLFQVVWINKFSILILNWVIVQNFQKLWQIWTLLDFQTRVPPKLLIRFSLSRSQLELPYSCWSFRVKITEYPVHWNPDGPEVLTNVCNKDSSQLWNSVSLYILTEFFFQDLDQVRFSCVGRLHLKSPVCFHAVGSWWTRNARKRRKSWQTHAPMLTHLSALHVPFSYQGVNQ